MIKWLLIQRQPRLTELMLYEPICARNTNGLVMRDFIQGYPPIHGRQFEFEKCVCVLRLICRCSPSWWFWKQTCLDSFTDRWFSRYYRHYLTVYFVLICRATNSFHLKRIKTNKAALTFVNAKRRNTIQIFQNQGTDSVREQFCFKNCRLNRVNLLHLESTPTRRSNKLFYRCTVLRGQLCSLSLFPSVDHPSPVRNWFHWKRLIASMTKLMETS